MKTNDPRTERALLAYREALTDLLHSKPLEQITVSELSKKAGYHRSTFYRHYNHVAELFDEIQKEMLNEFEKILERNPGQKDQLAGFMGNAEAIIKILAEAFRMIKRNSTFASIILANPSQSQLLRRLLASGRHYALDSAGTKLQQEDAEYLDRYYTFITGGFISTIQRWLEEDMKMSPADLAELCYKFISMGA